MEKVILGLFCLSLLGCSDYSQFKVGMLVTNVYCTGNIQTVYRSLEEAALINVKCPGYNLNFIFERLENLHPVVQ